jgi:tyrosine-protein kinase Etk/Wzc
LLAAVVGYGLSSLQTPLYQSSGTILLSDPRSTGDLASELSVFFDPGRYVRNQSAVIESPVVAERASEILRGTPSAEDIVGAISAEPEQDLDAITITAIGTNPAETTAIVTAVVTGYGDLISEGVQAVAKESIEQLEIAKAGLTERVEELDVLVAANPDDSALAAEQRATVDQLYDVDSQIKSLGISALLYGSGIQLYVAPDGPGFKISPRPLRNAAIAFVLGALAAGAFAWWKAEQDQRADTKDVPAEVLGAPLLAVIPEFESVKAFAPAPTITHVDSPASEAFHFALSSLSFILEQIEGTSVVITSADPGDGKTIVALNLAVVAKRDGRSPLLIDADERRRGLTFLAGLDDDHGVGVAIGLGHRWAITPEEEIDFIASGRNLDGDVGGYFRTAEFRKELQSAMAGRELVIIDTPPVMFASETADLAAEVDGVVLVVREGSPLRDLEDARSRIELSGTPIIGYIFNKASTADTAYRYSYSSK